MTGGELTASQIRALLQELGRRLQARGNHGDIKLVGGAALILQGIGNRPTADIDADPTTVNAVVTEMAAAYPGRSADSSMDLAGLPNDRVIQRAEASDWAWRVPPGLRCSSDIIRL
jgi:hypothetical protein